MEQIYFNYCDYTLDEHSKVNALIDLYTRNISEKNSFITPTNEKYSTNVLFRMRGSQLKTIDDIVQESKSQGIYEFLKIGIDELINFGIIGCYDFFPILMGNTEGLPIKLGVGQHIHHQVTRDRKCNVYLMIFPLDLKTEIKEFLKFTWTDKEYPLGSYDFIATSDFNKKLETHYENIRLTANGPTEYINFPNSGKRLSVKFNGTNWLHSAENFSDNLYLGIVVNDYIKK